MIIRTYPSNWLIIGEEKSLTIETSADKIDSSVYDNVDEIVEDFIERIEKAGFTVDENAKIKIETLVNSHFSYMF